jgi:hypothetical protein
MFCVLVPLLLKRNIGEYLEPSEALAVKPLFLVCHGSAIILWVLYIYVLSSYFCNPET